MAQPKGRIEEVKMSCKKLQGVTERVFSIYLPGSYDESTKRYPVVFLMHGGGGSHTDWQLFGHLRQLADSLIDSHVMPEMIVVCPEGNEQNMMYFNAPWWKYEDYFFDEFIPYIDVHYRTLADKQHRAIAGFSMGGGAAVVYGVHRPDCFALVYDISGYLRRQPLEFLKNDPSAEWRQQVIEDNNPILRVAQGSEADITAWRTVDWVISVGDHDFTLEANMDFVRALRQHGIPYTMHVSEGEHNWQYVQPAFTDFLLRAGRTFAR